MKYVDKILNYFTSNYLNNTKFHHSTLGYLKIFFERNNKLKTTFSSLGNVFRNSKWSDFKAQNIKTSLIKSYTTYLLTIVLLLIILTGFLGKYCGHILFEYVPFLGEVYETLSFSWTVFEDWGKAGILAVYSLWSRFKAKLVAKFYSKQQHIYNTLASLQKPKTRYYLPALNIELSETEARNHQVIEVWYKLNHSTRSLGNVNSAPTLPLDDSVYHYDSWNIYECLDDDFAPFVNHDTYGQIMSIELNYGLLPKEVLEIHQLDIESANFNKISAYNLALSLTGLNTQEALRSSKEDRWLLRNSLLSENLILNSNAFTQSKKLLGINFMNSDTASKNVWASSKLNSLGASNASNFLTNVQELFLKNDIKVKALSSNPQTNADMSNFEFFEDSRMWLTKKYFFTSQLKSNIKSITSTYEIQPSKTDLNNNTAFNILVNAQAHDPMFQLTSAALSLPCSTKLWSNPYTKKYANDYLALGDNDLLRSSNLVFMNKLTSSTSTSSLNYYTSLPRKAIKLVDKAQFTQK